VILRIERTWDGAPVAPSERATVEVVRGGRALHIGVDAPFWGDPPPPGPPGPTPRLWEHEVVELFVLGAHERYLEVELGPHGHHLVLLLRGRRNVERQGLPLDYTARIEGARWRAAARVPLDLLPPAAGRANAYLVHGAGAARRHLAAHAVPGAEPDFHRLECFGPFDP
jgi:hypothetical protein